MLGAQLPAQLTHQPHRLSLLLLGVPTRGRLPWCRVLRHGSILVSKIRSLQRTQGGSFAYDGAGRRTTETTGGQVSSHTYNPLGQLDTYTSSNGESQQRRYDPDGSPDTLTNTISGTTEDWALDWDHATGLAELASTTELGTPADRRTLTTQLARASMATPWATGTRADAHHTLGTDYFHNTIATTGNNIARSDHYDAWGVPDGFGTHIPKLGFHGELTDKSLTHLRARNYDVDTGNFTTTDPLPGIPGTTTLNNPYHYTNNNPINLADPSGLQADDNLFDPLIRSGGYDPLDFLETDCGLFGAVLADACTFVNILGSLDPGDCLDLGRYTGLCLDSWQKSRTLRLLGALEQAKAIIGMYSDILAGIFPGTDCINALDTHSRLDAAGCAAIILPVLGSTISRASRAGLSAADYLATGSKLTGGGARFIANSVGDVLDATRITIPEGKFGYLLSNSSKKGVFADSLGFTRGTLDPALRGHLIDNFGTATRSVPMVGGGTKFSVTGSLIGPSGQKWTITTAWGVDPDGTVRLITATP